MVTVLLFWEGEYGPIPGLKPRPGTRQSRHRRTARMLVDSGANVPILNEQFVNSNGRVPTGEREHPQKIRDATGQIIKVSRHDIRLTFPISIWPTSPRPCPKP